MEALAPRMAIQALLAERDNVSTAGVCWLLKKLHLSITGFMIGGQD